MLDKLNNLSSKYDRVKKNTTKLSYIYTSYIICNKQCDIYKRL